MGTAVSVVPVCTAGVQRLYCCHCLMPSVHSGTGTESQRVNEREKRIQLWNRERQNTIAAGRDRERAQKYKVVTAEKELYCWLHSDKEASAWIIL